MEFLLVTVPIVVFLLQSFMAQDDRLELDARCRGRAHLERVTCCIFPPFFRGDIARKCGAAMSLTYMSAKPNVTGIRRHVLHECDYWICLLKQYKLATEESKLDDEGYFMHLDRWVDANPEFSGVMLNAKIYCKQIYRVFMPIDVCEFFPFNECIRNYIRIECPRYIDSDECRKVKEFYEDCRDLMIHTVPFV